MTYYTRKELGDATGAPVDHIRRWEEAGLVHLAIDHGEGKARTILYDNNSLKQVQALLKEAAAEQPATKPPPVAARPIVNVNFDPAIELLTTISRDIRIEQEIVRNRHAEMLASLRTLAEEIRALRAVWEAGK